MDLLINFVTGFLQHRAEEDTFDRLNFQITPFLFVLLSLINITKVFLTFPQLLTLAKFGKIILFLLYLKFVYSFCNLVNTCFGITKTFQFLFSFTLAQQ